MADVSKILAKANNKKSIFVEREVPIDLDVALLAAFDPNPISSLEYNTRREECLKNSARDSIQTLVNALFQLPTATTSDAVVATLPTDCLVTVLPRAKPLPKPVPLTKWQKFANEKGIAPKPKRDRLVFDEDKQDWVSRWGWKGKNKDEENAWIREVKPGEDDSNLESNPGKKARKERTLKNENQRLKNLQRANAEVARSTTTAVLQASNRNATKSDIRAEKIAANTAKTRAEGLAKREEQAKRKDEVQALIKTTKKSTASLGKFDKQFEKEPKVKGVKRKFQPSELPAKEERENQMSIVNQLAKDPLAFKEKVIKRGKKSHESESREDKTKGLVNTRKAIRAVSGGRGAGAIAGVESLPTKKSKKRR
ncbi:ribosome biogenesis regulatory protein-domain-containing protein [Phakopsora pachyrhizi]|uniref:Ribosome biogenesis regulatory protein n=1 Tax=Phakopsora pachyrhizi TaxID=170000 RepID=A0AAV0B8H0_PHAPC|nr:ribosome biogenesis regulatory protein-domain-containing protein [Phakopsora pachyrhizi]CAH7683484.1 ribosome biogenesis regulatory protein-domain-containing protein [Phakopsora pachyrhizi]